MTKGLFGLTGLFGLIWINRILKLIPKELEMIAITFCSKPY